MSNLLLVRDGSAGMLLGVQLEQQLRKSRRPYATVEEWAQQVDHGHVESRLLGQHGRKVPGAAAARQPRDRQAVVAHEGVGRGRCHTVLGLLLLRQLDTSGMCQLFGLVFGLQQLGLGLGLGLGVGVGVG